MDVASLILTIVGLCVSGLAYLKAKSAKDAVDFVVGRRNEQVDRDRLRQLMEKLSAAKEAAKRRWAGAPVFLSAGYSPETDLHFLQEADDALKTSRPFEVERGLTDDLRDASKDIEQAVATIANQDPDRDGWKDALSTLQTIIPRLDQADRDIHNKELAGKP